MSRRIASNLAFKRVTYFTSLAVFQLVDQIKDSFNQNTFTLDVLGHLSKAFYIADHSKLLKNYLSISNSCLSNRRQYINSEKSLANILETYWDAHQSFILSTLLFIVYSNELVKASTSIDPTIFADDPNIIYSNCSIRQFLTTTKIWRQEITHWFGANKLLLNIENNVMITNF